MPNPYKAQPDTAFWRRAVSGHGPAAVDPVVDMPFQIGPRDRVATVGSCFAQHIAHALPSLGLRFNVTEAAPLTPDAADEGFGIYPARFGNVYTVRQLRQLLERAFFLFDPIDVAWPVTDADGRSRFVDPFRPRVQTAGFPSIAAVIADRDAHLLAVQEMFETCDVLIFTLGLTEGWEAAADGAVFPLAPGVVSPHLDDTSYRFHNFSVGEMEDDLRAFIARLQAFNPSVRLILTVSPVALAATYEAQHVLVANTYSKAALRVVAETMAREFRAVAYFPSFEIITGPQARGQFLADDLRQVTAAGVAHVMSIFRRHVVADASADAGFVAGPATPSADTLAVMEAAMRARQRVICDEDAIEAAP